MDRFRNAFGYGSRPQQAESSHHHTTTRRLHPSSSSSSSSLTHIPRPQIFSDLSSPAIPDSMWHSSDFLLGVGMVILQPSTDKVVLVYETERKYWFLPKGRKDIGESLEQAALREAYEESGYRVEFLPLFTPTNAPPAPNSDHDFFDFPNTEPFYVSALAWNKRTRRQGRPPRTGDNGGEYLTFWYVGQIPDGAVPELNTGMPDEKNYKSYLLTFDEALHVTQGNAAPMTRKLVCAAYTLLTSTRRTMVAMEQATLLDHLNVDNDHSSGEDRREDRRA